MDELDDRKQRSRATTVRLLVLAALCGGFLAVATVMNPDETRAVPDLARRGLDMILPKEGKVPADAARPPSRDRHGWMLLGEMVGRKHRVWVYGRGAEVRYTVCTLEGEVLMADMEADNVYRLFPELDLSGMRLNPSPQVAENATGPIMMMDREEPSR